MPSSEAKPSDEAIVGLITSHQPALRAFIVALIPDYVAADDVLQETNLVLWRKAAEFDPARPFRSWAFGIARFQAMAFLKRARSGALVFSDPNLVEALAEAAAEIGASDDGRSAALQQCLAALSMDERKLVDARYAGGHTVRELARSERRSEGALQQALFRIRGKLRACIERVGRAEAPA